MNKMSRVDIYVFAMGAGVDDDSAWAMACDLSPECEGVPTMRVARAINAFLSDPSGKVSS